MDIIFRGQHLTISDEFRSRATGSIEKLGRHLPMADHAIVDVRRESKGEEGRYVVQVTVSANGTFLRAEERNYDLLAAVDAATRTLDGQAKRFKERKILRSERRVDKEELAEIVNHPPGEPTLQPDVELIEGRVVRVKQFSMKPMTEAEAIEQMELLGHNFFLFHDADRDDLALLYRRRDGDYGMIVRESP